MCEDMLASFRGGRGLGCISWCMPPGKEALSTARSSRRKKHSRWPLALWRCRWPRVAPQEEMEVVHLTSQRRLSWDRTNIPN